MYYQNLQINQSVKLQVCLPIETRPIDPLESTTLPGIRTKVVYPETEGGRPHLRLQWDKSDINLTVKEAQTQLEKGEPSIRTCFLGLSDGELEIGTAMLKDKEVDILVKRIRAVMLAAKR